MENLTLKWQIRGLTLAKNISTWSKDPSTQVGCLITDLNNRPISWGYNGFPRNIRDDNYRLNSRQIKSNYIIHAEVNAILNCRNIKDLKNSILYVYPCPPCNECAKIISQVEIKKIVTTTAPKEMENRWDNSLKIGKSILEESNIELIIRDISELYDL